MNAAPHKQKLPVDVQSFEIMRTQNYLYVDKTRHIYRMATEGTFYFLSRPRRFGKSLLVSTPPCAGFRKSATPTNFVVTLNG